MSLDDMWGNPAAKSFKQRYIRTVKCGGASVLVHRDVTDLVTAILRSATQEHGEIGPLRSWAKWEEGEKVRLIHYGLTLYGANISMLKGHAEKWGYVFNAPMMSYDFYGTPEEADALAQKAETERIAALPNTITKAGWYNGGPGSRVMAFGDMGDDVQCFQLAVDCPTQSGHFDEKTVEYARTLNHRFGIPHDVESINEDSWKGLLRLRRGMLSRGDMGAQVRVLQAALVAYDWQHDLRITGVFDRATDAAVRGLQETLGLRVSGIVRQPEWYALLQKNYGLLTPRLI